MNWHTATVLKHSWTGIQPLSWIKKLRKCKVYQLKISMQNTYPWTGIHPLSWIKVKKGNLRSRSPCKYLSKDWHTATVLNLWRTGNHTRTGIQPLPRNSQLATNYSESSKLAYSHCSEFLLDWHTSTVLNLSKRNKCQWVLTELVLSWGWG